MEGPNDKTSAYLTQIYGENTSRKYKLMCMKVTIGRSVHAEIRLQNPNVSRNHCTLFRNENGWTITDNKSQNGTFISGRKLKPGENKLLQCGDIIFLGPPSEMPEAFCFDDAFVDDEDILESGHEIIELPSVKRRAEGEIIVSKKINLGRKNSDVESNKILPPSAKNGLLKKTELESLSKEMPNASQQNNNKSNEEEVSIHRNENPPIVKSITDSESLTQVNKTDSEIQSPHPSSANSSSLKLLNDCDSGFQINEISSTGDDQAENSLSLLDLENNDIDKPSCSSSCEDGKSPRISKDPQTSTEIELLKSKLALLSERMKKVEESKLHLLKNYEVVCEKNFALDQQLAEKKKMEEDLKSCEKKVQEKIKNELLEKFEEDLICNICTELLIKPTVLDCTHTFCLFCIKEWKKKKNECPICRHKIQTMTPVLTLEHFIDKTLSTLTPEQKERRNLIITERNNQPKKAVTPTSRRSRHGRRRNRRSLTSINPRVLPQSARENDVQIVAERRNILPIPIAPLTIPRMFYSNFRIPEMLLGNDGDSSISIEYVPIV